MAIKLQMNVPQTFELAFEDGLRVNSRFGGDQVMFTLTTGERWYCDPFIAAKIRDAKIGANTPFSITKREVISGNRRVVEYEVERILEQSLAAPAARVTDAAKDARATVRAVESPDGATAAVFLGAGASPSSVAVMKLAGIGAIDAVLEVEHYAQSRGMTDFAFGADNIQRLAATLFIEMSKRAGRA